MQKLWNYVSNLGTGIPGNYLNRRTIVMSNQLNLVMFYTMLLLLLAVLTTALLTDDIISYGTLRVAITLILSVVNLLLSGYGFTRLSRLSLVFLSPVVFLLGPTLIGYVEEESYTYYNYVLICVSIVPQLLIHPKKEKYLFWLAMAYYFVLVVLIDKIMVYYGTNSYPIVDRINTFYPFFKIAHITLFIFINSSVYYLRALNFHYEDELNIKNQALDLQNMELKAQKEEIERQKDELVTRETDAWQKLVKIISHEIVNSAIPITNLAGMTAQMLEDEAGNVQKPEDIGQEVIMDIHHGLRVIESRTTGLVNFVRATRSLTDIPKPNPRNISVQDLFGRLSVLFRQKLRESNVEFKTKVFPVDLAIFADLEMIEQVLINLIQNALEAMKDTKKPQMELNAVLNESGHLQISVSDNGTGISDEVMERIFIPFYSTKNNNSGIGLSISRQILMLHHARLEVSSSEMNGSVFAMIF